MESAAMVDSQGVRKSFDGGASWAVDGVELQVGARQTPSPGRRQGGAICPDHRRRLSPALAARDRALPAPFRVADATAKAPTPPCALPSLECHGPLQVLPLPRRVTEAEFLRLPRRRTRNRPPPRPSQTI